MSLTITTESHLPENIKANVVSTMNSNSINQWSTLPFSLINDRTLLCHVTPEYPGLHSFRVEFSLDNGVSWIRDNVPDAWVMVDPPQVDGLCMYTMIPNVSGAIVDWKNDLKRIKDMGFNAVHLLPITNMDASKSPYSARDLFDIDKSYLIEGSEQKGFSQLEEYIEEAKRLNIRLCFDLVLNHIGVQSTMVHRAPDWIVPDQNQPDGFHRAGFWSEHGWRTWDDLVLINYEHPSDVIRSEIWAYMTEYVLFWAKYANDTGGFVRFDNLHSSNPEFVQSLTFVLHSEYPEVGLLGEFFTDENTLLQKGAQWGLNLNLATPWNYKFVPQLRDYLKYIHRVSRHIRYYMPITTHDSGTPEQEFASAESTIPRYVAAALMGTGATGITQGVEFGWKKQISFIGSQPKLIYPPETRFAEFIRKVNTILADYQVFRCGDNLLFLDNGHPAILAAFRKDPLNKRTGFLIVCNFDTQNQQYLVIDLSPFLETGWPFTCTELLSGEENICHQSAIELLLSPGAAKVFKFTQ